MILIIPLLVGFIIPCIYFAVVYGLPSKNPTCLLNRIVDLFFFMMLLISGIAISYLLINKPF